MARTEENSNPNRESTHRYSAERFRMVYYELLRRGLAGPTEKREINHEVREDEQLNGGMIWSILRVAWEDPGASFEETLFQWVRHLEQLHVGSTPAPAEVSRQGMRDMWAERWVALRPKKRVETAETWHEKAHAGATWNDWELIAALQGIEDSIRRDVDPDLFAHRVLCTFGTEKGLDPYSAEAERVYTILGRALWFFKAFRLVEASDIEIFLWRQLPEHLTSLLATELLRRRKETRRGRIGQAVIEAITRPALEGVNMAGPGTSGLGATSGSGADRLESQAIRWWSERLVKEAALGEQFRRFESGAPATSGLRAIRRHQRKELSDAELIDLMRTLLRNVRAHRSGTATIQYGEIWDLERQVERLIGDSADAVLEGTEEYVQAIKRLY